ncbi:hypothetical protein FJY84_04505 [Candidatus Bathyarchaeota archaeon]|nr:hypothetical protein [Candidatus Bathyarchaeota archaeon]
MTIEEYLTVNKWLERLSPSTQRLNKDSIKRFIKWLSIYGGEFKNYTPDDLIEYQKNANNGNKFNILDYIEKYVSNVNGTTSYKKNIYNQLRSFFLHNRTELPKDPSFKIRGNREKIQGILKIEEIRDLILSSSLMYQSVFMAMFSAGLGSEELVYWSNNGWDKLKKDIENEEKIISIKLPGRKGRKNEAPFFSYLGGDALEKLNGWANIRPINSKSIFIDQHGNPLTKKGLYMYWFRHLNKLGYSERQFKRTGRAPHELRDCFRSQWAKSGANSDIAESMMGHVVDPLGYNKAYLDQDFAKKEYRKALPFLNIFSSNRPYGQVSEEIVNDLQEQIFELKQFQTNIMNILMNNKDSALESVFSNLERNKFNITERNVESSLNATALEKGISIDETKKQLIKNAEDFLEKANKNITKLKLIKNKE